MFRESQLRVYNITSKAAVTIGIENWFMKQINKHSRSTNDIYDPAQGTEDLTVRTICRDQRTS